MKIKISSLISIIYLVLLYLRIEYHSNIFLISLCLLNLILLLWNDKNFELVALSSFLMDNEIFILINILICMGYGVIRKGQIKTIKGNSKILLCCGLIAANAVINTFIRGNLPNLIFGLLYYLLIFSVGYTLEGKLDYARIISAIKHLVLVEGMLILYTLIFTDNMKWRRGDIYKGSLSDAHMFGFWLICMIITIFCYYSRKYSVRENLWHNFGWYSALLIMLYLAEAKAIILALTIALFLYAVLRFFTGKTNMIILYFNIALVICMSAGMLLLRLSFVKDYITDNYSNVSLYVYNNNYNYKYYYFDRTVFEELKGPRAFLGFGIGHYGSRIANMFGYDYMYRDANEINRFVSRYFDSFILPEYRRYASQYSNQIVQEIRWRSAILTYPYSSLMAILAENGIIGFLLFIYIFAKIAKNSNSRFLVAFFMACCIFDLFFDRVGSCALVLLLVMNSTLPEKQEGLKLTGEQAGDRKGVQIS